MRFYDLLKQPVDIQGQQVIIIPDVVGPVSSQEQHEYVEISSASDVHPSIYAREDDIQEMRELHPHLPIYGMWQVLFASEQVSLLSELQVIETNDFDGYYLHCENGKAAFSGIYEAGFFAASTHFSLANALPINPSAEELSLPERQAFLAVELRTQNKIAAQKNWMGWGGLIALILVVSFIIDFSLESYYQYQNKSLTSKLAEQRRLIKELNTIKKTRLTRLPDDWNKMQSVVKVWQAFPNLSTLTPTNFDQKVTFKLENKGYDPAMRFAFLQTQIQQDDTWRAVMR